MASIAAARCYKVILIMPAHVTVERRIVLRAFGAELFITDPSKGFQSVMEKSEEMLKHTPRGYMLRQFDNFLANQAIHYEATGPEIWKDSGGKVDVLVSGIGTAGTSISEVSSQEALETAKLLALKESLLLRPQLPKRFPIPL